MAALATALSAQYAMTIPAGSYILVRLNQTIDSRTADEGRVYSATIDQDVLDIHGNVAIPKGSPAEVLVRQVAPKDELVLDLQSVIVGGRRYFVNTDDVEIARTRAGIGKNARTAKLVGGGAIFGTILGSITGGGKGAAVGAVAGAAGGGALQTVTRGKAVRVPAETVVTFHLERPLRLYLVE
ncbi:MAG: hypothetical protein JWO80_6249 [Bryobacterales bacterium]|nr:hypothetical protein [Bryobacterales bacterium]